MMWRHCGATALGKRGAAA